MPLKVAASDVAQGRPVEQYEHKDKCRANDPPSAGCRMPTAPQRFGLFKPRTGCALQVDTEKPKSGSTSDIRPWYNRKARSHTAKSQVNLANGTTLVIKVKGQDTQEQRAALDEWVRAVTPMVALEDWPGTSHSSLAKSTASFPSSEATRGGANPDCEPTARVVAVNSASRSAPLASSLRPFG